MIRTFCLSLVVVGLSLLSLSAYGQSTSSTKEEDFRNTPEPDFFHYMKAERSMLKINVIELVKRFQNNGVLGVIHLGYEQKWSPAWSLNTEAGLGYFFTLNNQGSPDLQLNSSSIGLTLGPRFYYNLKRRMLRNLSQDNLSANYVTLHSSSTLTRKVRAGINADNRIQYHFHTVAVSSMWGMQRRIMDIGYLDFSLGLQLSYGEDEDAGIYIPVNSGQNWGLIPVSNFRLGIAF
ncbi:MAG: hypothetical protein AAF388_04750 [Bacteroidota bacterium]